MESKSEFRVIALSERFAEKVRQTRKSPGYGHPVHAEAAHDHWPCRVCLSRKEPHGEGRLLFTLDPFHGIETLPLPGPVFIHEEAVRALPRGRRLPGRSPAGAADVQRLRKGRKLRAQEAVEDGDVEPTIRALLARRMSTTSTCGTAPRGAIWRGSSGA